jgi:hypothetical protein
MFVRLSPEPFRAKRNEEGASQTFEMNVCFRCNLVNLVYVEGYAELPYSCSLEQDYLGGHLSALW